MFIRLAAGAAALLLAAATPAHAQVLDPAFSRFEQSSDAPGPRIDYSVWTGLLQDIVLDVGLSDRQPARGVPIMTGTRINTSNTSRYRFEANRVIFHLLTDEYRDAISEYRRDLESIPGRENFSTFSSDEQLAYWINLHNVTVIEQIALRYPVSSVRRIRIGNDRERLFDAKLLTVDGVSLSLNDIRLRIVYARWRDPLVLYGFFNGAIGGPNIRREAYTGSDVWTQLDSNAREFINSLRGVEIGHGELRVSELYGEARETLFPRWPEGLRTHLAAYAVDSTLEEIDGSPVDARVSEWGIADMINGSRRCTGSVGDPLIQSYAVNQTSYVSTASSCVGMPPNAQVLLNRVIERRRERIRSGAYGRVYLRDVPTEDVSAPVETPEDRSDEES